MLTTSKLAKFLAVGLALGGLAVAGTSTALGADKPVRWKAQSWFPLKLPHVGQQILDIGDKLEKVSGGNIQLKAFEPGALVPPTECFDGVAKGSLDVCWSVSAYDYGKNPALVVFSALPFGPEWPELLAYFYYGGGKEMYEQLYAKDNIKPLVCGGTVAEGSAWTRKEVNSASDFKGMKFRIMGLAARTLEKLGTQSQLLPAGDIFPALELGTIDATEFAMPAIDLKLGFYQVAKHYYWPGWHQPATLYHLLINMERWKSLSPTQQMQFEMVCGDNVRQAIAEGEAKQLEPLAELKAKGVTVHQWSPEMIEVFRKAWQEVAAEESAKSPDFKKAYDHYVAFRAKYKTWSDMAYVK